MDMYIEVNGKIAKIELPETGDEDDGYWESLAAGYPNAYDLIDEKMVVPDCTVGGWDAAFGEGDDDALVAWIEKEKTASEGWCITVDGKPDLDGEDMVFGTESEAIAFIDSCPCYDGLGERVKAEPWKLYKQERSVPESVTAYKRIRTSGRTLIVYVKEECDQLGIGYGDYVKIEIRRADDDEDRTHRPRTVRMEDDVHGPLRDRHDDGPARPVPEARAHVAGRGDGGGAVGEGRHRACERSHPRPPHRQSAHAGVDSVQLLHVGEALEHAHPERLGRGAYHMRARDIPMNNISL